MLACKPRTEELGVDRGRFLELSDQPGWLRMGSRFSNRSCLGNKGRKEEGW